MRKPGEVPGLIGAHAAGLGVFTGLQVISLLAPALKMQLFCGPSAVLASLFLGTPCVETSFGFQLPHPGIDIRVIESCSGYDFFSLLLAVLAGIVVRQGVRLGTRLSLLVPLCFGIAILANTVRILSAVQVRLFVDLPGLSPGVSHVIVGVSVFALFLALACHFTRSIYAKP